MIGKTHKNPEATKFDRKYASAIIRQRKKEFATIEAMADFFGVTLTELFQAENRVIERGAEYEACPSSAIFCIKRRAFA